MASKYCHTSCGHTDLSLAVVLFLFILKLKCVSECNVIINSFGRCFSPKRLVTEASV